MRPHQATGNNRCAFFFQFLKHPLQIGSVIPSSRFLERRIIEMAEVERASTIVELGSGTGGTTRAILRAMPSEARFLSIEINPYFYSLVKQIDDPRFKAHCGSAFALRQCLSMYSFPPPDVIVSGIPFSCMRFAQGIELVDEIYALLADNGRFVAYQAKNRVASLCNPFLGSCRTSFELLNIPPMRIYRWDKHEA